MRKLNEVQQAKELMLDAIDWSTFKWLFEKPRVRETADRANAALDRLEKSVKARWTDDLKTEYRKLSGKAGGAARKEQKGQPAPLPFDPEARVLLENVLHADRAAERARIDAEKTFEEAERQLSTSLAREGCKKAIHSWELHEKAIRKAEAMADPASTES